MLTKNLENYVSGLDRFDWFDPITEEINISGEVEIIHFIQEIAYNKSFFSISQYSKILELCTRRLLEIKCDQQCQEFIEQSKFDFESRPKAEVISIDDAMLFKSISDFTENFTKETVYYSKEITPDDIKQIRKKLNLTQERFAKTLGISVSTIRNWEQGLRKPSKKSLQNLRNL